MFFAINSQTNEKINSLTIESNPSYQFIQEDIWLADSDEIESCPKDLDITKIKVRFREGKSGVINYNGTKYDISPHFFIPNKSKLDINTIPESKEHKLAKNWIYNKIKQKDLKIIFSEVNKPNKYSNSINLFDLPIDISKIGIEVSSSITSKSRKADVICPFLTKHEILGLGIVFEIQFGKQKERTKIIRELDWAIRGYSLAWLLKEDFNEISDLLIDLKKPEVKVESFANLIKQNNKDMIRELKFVVQDLCRQFDDKRNEIESSLNSTLNKIREEKIKLENLKGFDANQFDKFIKNKLESMKDLIQPKCPRCSIPMRKIKNKMNDEIFWGCANYPSCKQTMPYD